MRHSDIVRRTSTAPSQPATLGELGRRVRDLEFLTRRLKVTAGGSSSIARTVPVLFDGGGSVLTTGIKYDGLEIPWNATITGWSLYADQSGSIVVDVWKDTYANYPPTSGDSITASAKPTLSSASANKSSTLTGWTTAITAGDVLRFNINSVSTITRAELQLHLLT